MNEAQTIRHCVSEVERSLGNNLIKHPRIDRALRDLERIADKLQHQALDKEEKV
jgi:hypothetical protein